MNSEQSIFEAKIDPLVQAGVTLGAVLLVDIVGTAFASPGLNGEPSRFAWLCGTSFLLFFAIGNAIFSAASDNMMKYWGRSLYAFMGLAAGAGLLAWAFTGLSIGEAGSYRWIYLVVTVGYLVFLSLIAMIKNVVTFAQREEWNRPKMKSGAGKKKGRG